MKFRRRTIAGLEIAYLDCTGRAFAKHAHDEFVIGANVVGREHIWLDGASHEAQTAEVTLYNPGQVQAGDARNNPWAFFSLYVEPAWLRAQFGLEGDIAFEKPVAAMEVHAEAIRILGGSALRDETDDGEILEVALLVLGQLVDCFSSGALPNRSTRFSREAAIVHDWLLDDVAAPPSVSELAAFVGLTPVRLVRAFTRAYRLPPHQWLNVQRLKQARRALRESADDLAGLAIDLGFADQAHFTRRFAAMYGVTPAVYARG
jgi:AraC family chemosensory pili system transcriptional regulator ChpD